MLYLQLLHEIHHIKDKLDCLNLLRDRIKRALQHAVLGAAAIRRPAHTLAVGDVHGILAHDALSRAEEVGVGIVVFHFARHTPVLEKRKNRTKYNTVRIIHGSVVDAHN